MIVSSKAMAKFVTLWHATDNEVNISIEKIYQSSNHYQVVKIALIFREE